MATDRYPWCARCRCWYNPTFVRDGHWICRLILGDEATWRPWEWIFPLMIGGIIMACVLALALEIGARL